MTAVKQTSPLSICHRRSLLAAGVLLPQLRWWPQKQAHAAQVLKVGIDQEYKTIAAAVAVAQPGSTILIAPGRYEEQLQIASSITLAAAQQGGHVVITCNTQQPYIHCLEVPSSSSQDCQVVVQGISFEHYSKSVANNYCIFAQGGRLSLQDCDITSNSGVGVGVEGAAVTLERCNIHDCERHGVAVYGSLEGAAGHCDVLDCSISSNKLCGILAKDGAELTARRTQITGNGSYGVQLAYCTADLQENTVRRNKLGSVAVQLGTVTVDEGQLQAQNDLSEEVLLL